ncbi:MAG TPA: MarR family winged helix-turn-helix transcriptional regulator [Streptosporangiaceae bacterium]|nr:MarR family winged helix-turn-helix transcriptional regulator [Streptosporangiaceae bacterium]HYA51002.1 MarR family winged helix-turn-helix transcriptional regulator [Streptosporangiaceae bacterium]
MLGGAEAKVLSAMAARPYQPALPRRDCSAVNVPGTTTRTAEGDGVAAGRAEMQGQVIGLLRAVARGLRRQHVALAAGRGFPLSGPYLALLQEIARHPGVTVSELARLTGLPKSRVSVLTTRLVAEWAVRKEPDEHDSRLVLLVITPEGRRRAAEWSVATRQAVERLLQPLRDDELVAIVAGLTALQRAFRQAEERSPEERPARGCPGGVPSC